MEESTDPPTCAGWGDLLTAFLENATRHCLPESLKTRGGHLGAL